MSGSTDRSPALDTTHDPALRSWVAAGNDADTDFPIQNLPFGRFREADDPDWRIGVAIGDQILDLRRCGLINHADMNRLVRLQPDTRRALRLAISAGLREGSAQAARWAETLVPMARAELALPCEVGDYTDFYIGVHHATAVGRLFRPDQPLLPNYHWVPIGYHGRASTLRPSGTDFRRPLGQIRPDADAPPRMAPSQRLDFELEMAVWIGRPNAMGEPVTLATAEDHVFGLGLLNDWSARDVQAWEYQPLGPFLSKSFATTVSPWIVTLDALAPFRRGWQRDADLPQPLPYLDSAANRAHGAFDIDLEVTLQSAAMQAAGLAPQVISQSNFADAAHWTFAQLVAHHTVNGCSLSPGDLFGTGTLSGPQAGQQGSLLELTRGGREALALASGEQRRFLEDGDRIALRARAQRAGHRSIGFGPCTAVVLPAPALNPERP
ncbi:fumarylacetoacetase [Pseudaquabacterium rugosum]|uniref:fumarylacetoacetase n=1 Tax=Pseudaquabacterium rugosum TaxID=2984194 RepID=A0ABU9BEV7_9BURK